MLPTRLRRMARGWQSGLAGPAGRSRSPAAVRLATEPIDEGLDSFHWHPGRPTDVDEFELPAADQLVDRRASDAEGLAGVLDGEEEDELVGVARLGLARAGGRLRRLCLPPGLTATRAEAGGRYGTVLDPEPEQVPSGVPLVRVSPPSSGAAVSQEP